MNKQDNSLKAWVGVNDQQTSKSTYTLGEVVINIIRNSRYVNGRTQSLDDGRHLK